MKRRTLAVTACVWVLWAQTRTSGPRLPVTDAWDIVDTFETREECERARVVIEQPTVKPVAGWPLRTRYVCFPDTLDPQATP
jgi:hypothetical protein